MSEANTVAPTRIKFGQRRQRERVPSHIAVIEGPHSEEIREFLTGLEQVDGIDSEQLERIQACFEENHVNLVFSTERYDSQQRGAGGPLLDQQGRRTLDPTRCGVWIGPRDLQITAQTGQTTGTFIARMWQKGGQGSQAQRAPQIVNVFNDVNEDYQGKVEAQVKQAEASATAPTGAEATPVPAPVGASGPDMEMD